MSSRPPDPAEVDLVIDDMIRAARSHEQPLDAARADALWGRIEEELPKTTPPRRRGRRVVSAAVGLGLLAAAAVAVLASRPIAAPPAPTVEARALPPMGELPARPPRAELVEATALPVDIEGPFRELEQLAERFAIAAPDGRPSIRRQRVERTPAPPPPALPAPPEYRAAARSALAAGDLVAAATHLESLIVAGHPGPTELATTRLELARLYGNHLGRPLRAAQHLRALLDASPDDPAAASVFRELCRLSARAGRIEPLCPPRAASTP